MKLVDISGRLAAPFASTLVQWKSQAISKDKTRALMVPYVDARAIMDRLDAVCPGEWSFDLEVVQGVPVRGTTYPTVKGTLTICGVSRSDIGEGDPTTDAGTLKAAASDALKRAAVHFGVGRYLYDLESPWVDWNDQKREAKRTPLLPDWARPDFEKTPGGAHIAQALEQLKYDAPVDLGLQREVYKHLKAALASISPDAAPRGAQRPIEPEQAPEALVPSDEAGTWVKEPLVAEEGEVTTDQLKKLGTFGTRAGAKTTEDRAKLWGSMLGRDQPVGTHDMSTDDATVLLDTLNGIRADVLKTAYAAALARFPDEIGSPV